MLVDARQHFEKEPKSFGRNPPHHRLPSPVLSGAHTAEFPRVVLIARIRLRERTLHQYPWTLSRSRQAGFRASVYAIFMLDEYWPTLSHHLSMPSPGSTKIGPLAANSRHENSHT